MSTHVGTESDQPLNWTAIAALYAALCLGLVWAVYSGHYRNAAWLALLGVGGGLTAYGRVLEGRGARKGAQRWKGAAGVVYAVFVIWVGVELLQVLMTR